MNYELLKNEFIKLKKEELDYIDSIARISSNKKLSENEKLEIYRTLKDYQIKLNEKLAILRYETIDRIREDEKSPSKKLKEVIIRFDINKDYLSSLKFRNNQYKEYILEKLGIDIETFEFKLIIYDLIYNHGGYRGIDVDTILNNQNLIEIPIYIFNGYYDYTEECYGPCLGEHDDYLYGIYENIRSKDNYKEKIPKKKMDEFEKDKIIIYSKRYVDYFEVSKIFEEELSNNENKTLNDCVIETKNRIEGLNYKRSPEYKEKILLNIINELYKKVKGEFIQSEILYSDHFLDVVRETYKLSNEEIIKKEKIVKKGKKNPIIVIALTQDKEYIITFKNKIKDKINAEFPLIYMEDNGDVVETIKRQLKEKTGYITDDLFIVDELNIDDSVTYVVIANNCIKYNEENINSAEFINYGLFSEKELKYLINKNIMNGAMDKLAYYSMVNNVDDCNVTYLNSNKKIYKTLKKKRNPIDDLK